MNSLRSRSSVHFVDEFDEPYHRRRPPSRSRHSSVEEVVASRPRSYSRCRRPVYVDGAADTQTDDARWHPSSAEEHFEPSMSVGEKGSGSSKPLEDSTASGYRRSPSSASVKVLPPTAAEVSNLNDRARITFADYSYEVDFQFPSPPPVLFSVPVHRQRRSLSPLHIPTTPIPRNSRHDDRGRPHIEVYSPAHNSNEGSTPIHQQAFYERSMYSSDPLSHPESNQDPGTPRTSITSSVPRPVAPETATMTADDPNHPDHLAYLLSSAQIVPSSDRKGSAGAQEDHTGRMAYHSQTVTPRCNNCPSYCEYVKAGLIVLNSDGGVEEAQRFETEVDPSTANRLASNEDDNFEDVDQEFYYHERLPGYKSSVHDIFNEAELEQVYYETQLDYEAEGKAHIENLRRHKAMQDHEAVSQWQGSRAFQTADDCV